MGTNGENSVVGYTLLPEDAYLFPSRNWSAVPTVRACRNLRACDESYRPETENEQREILPKLKGQMKAFSRCREALECEFERLKKERLKGTQTDEGIRRLEEYRKEFNHGIRTMVKQKKRLPKGSPAYQNLTRQIAKSQESVREISEDLERLYALRDAELESLAFLQDEMERAFWEGRKPCERLWRSVKDYRIPYEDPLEDPLDDDPLRDPLRDPLGDDPLKGPEGSTLGDCPICMYSVSPRDVKLRCCGNLMHERCLSDYKKYNRGRPVIKCPLCNNPLDERRRK